MVQVCFHDGLHIALNLELRVEFKKTVNLPEEHFQLGLDTYGHDGIPGELCQSPEDEFRLLGIIDRKIVQVIKGREMTDAIGETRQLQLTYRVQGIPVTKFPPFDNLLPCWLPE